MMGRIRRKRARERGAAAVIVGLSLSVVFGMAALVIDVGQIYNVKAELQNSADAAALAAASHLDNHTQAVAVAQQWAQENHEGQPLVVLPSDVVLGHWDRANDKFIPGGLPTDAVEVTARRIDARGNPVDHAFGGAIGNPSSDVVARAVAKANFTLIDFEDNYSSGDVPTTLSYGNGISGDPVSGYVTITGAGNGPGHPPMIFDGTCGGAPFNCTGGDDDLYQPAQGNILILSEDGDSNDPDDEAHGGIIEFDFSNLGDGTVTIGSLVVIDSEQHRVVTITLYRDGNVIAVSEVPGAGDGQLETRFPTAVPDIDYMTIELEDSGAIDDIGYSFGVSLVQ